MQPMFWYIEWDILAIDGITLTVQVTGTGLGFDVLVSPSVLSNLPHKLENSQKQEIRERKIFSKVSPAERDDWEINFSDKEIRSFSEFSQISLWIHHHKTDVSELLFGFVSPDERRLFRDLNKVNGIGGKTALALLGLGEERLIQAIQMEDDKLLSSVPWIGKKTAQKIIVDLKGSIDFSKKSSAPITNNHNQNDTILISSLVSMWYDKARVEIIISSIETTLSLEARTIEAIRRLAK